VTSPGGNLVEIRIVSKDLTGPGFDSATARAKGLAKAIDGGAGSAGAALVSAEKKASGFGSALGRVGEVAGGMLLAEGIQVVAERAVALVRSTVTAASDLGESVNAVDKVFGASAEAIHDWGKANANAFGLSTRAFNSMATPLGAMLKNQGLTMEQVTEHTIKLTKRSADMASIFNTDVTEALESVQAGLRGESDPLEKYGVGLSAAAVEARALADTGKETAAALTQQEIALARLNIIYDQTASTAGDFRDNAEGLANAQRIATAQIEEAQAKVGTAFLPVFAKAAQVAGNFATAVTALPSPLTLTAAAVVAVAAALLLLAPRIVATREALTAMAESDSRVQRGMSKTAVAVGKAGAALAAFTVAAQIAGSFMDLNLNPQVDAATEGLSGFAKTGLMAGEAARLFGADGDKLDRSLRAMSSSSHGFGKFVESWISPLQAADQSATKVEERIGALDLALSELVRSGRGDEAAKLFQQIADRGVVSIDELRAALPGYVGAVEVAARGTKDLGGAAKDAGTDIDAMSKSFDDALDSAFSLAEAEDRAADGVQRLRDQIAQQIKAHEDGAGTLDRQTQAGRDNAAMVRDLVRDYKDMILEYNEAGRSTDGLKLKLENELVAMGLSRTAAMAYTRTLGDVKTALDAIPSSKTIVIRTTAQLAIEQIHETAREARAAFRNPVHVNIVPVYGPVDPNRSVPGRAHGGITGAESGGARGGWTMVGERGRELVKLPYGSTVVPNGTTESMMSGPGSGGSNSTLTVLPGGSGMFEDFMVEFLRRFVQFQGAGSTQTAFGRN
jgi:hypothetical protein